METNQIIEALNYLLAKLGLTDSCDIPALLERFTAMKAHLNYVTSNVGFLLMAVAVGLIIWVAIEYHKSSNKRYCDSYLEYFTVEAPVRCVLVCLFGIVGIVMFICGWVEAYKWTTIPELMLINYCM